MVMYHRTYIVIFGDDNYDDGLIGEKKMLNREQYNAVFGTDLTQEQFDEIMGNPIDDFTQITEFVMTDKYGHKVLFVPKANVIPINWLIQFEVDNGQEVRLQEAMNAWEKIR